MDEHMVIEKVGEYKKAMKAFVKGLIKSKLFTNENNEITVTIDKNICSDTKERFVSLTVKNCNFTAIFNVEVSTRVFNKVDPTLFEALADQLSRSKNAYRLIVE